MKPFICLLAFALTLAAGQRQGASPQYGAPVQAPRPAKPQAPRPPPPPPPQAAPLPAYGAAAPVATAASLAEGNHDHDHQGLDWLLESVPGTPGTDYPIYSQDALGGFTFDCNGQVEGGYYADPASQCQAFHVCIPDGQGSLGTQSFLCPNGTIFNQEYFICDWWFNFDCSQAAALYSRNDEVAREREQATQAQASNQQNSYAKPAAAASNQQNTYAKPAAAAPQVNRAPAQPAQNNYNDNQQQQQQPAGQPSYSG